MNLRGVQEIRVRHRRPAQGGGTLLWKREDFLRRGTKPAAKGGMTTVIVVLPDGRTGVGVSYCSKQDNFSYSTGRRIALDRALMSLKEVRS